MSIRSKEIGMTQQIKSLDVYRQALKDASLSFAALDDLPIIIPKADKVIPHHWPFAEVKKLVLNSLEFQEKLPTGLAGAERRFLRLKNPGIPDETVTNTMSLSVQLLMPGEKARPHRHTIVAFRFFIEGRAYTVDNGDRVDMQPGDLVLTPAMHWHAHGNDSDEQALWFDGLDLGLVRYLDGVLKQDTEEMKITARTGATKRRYGTAGLRPAIDLENGLEQSSMIHYKWKDTAALLRDMAKAEDSNPYDDIGVEYVNPYNGAPVFATLACRAQMIRPGITTRKRRQTCHRVYHAVEGSGTAVIDGKNYEWNKGDFFVVPSMSFCHHVNAGSEPAFLFSVSDDPTMRKLGFFREEVEKQAE